MFQIIYPDKYTKKAAITAAFGEKYNFCTYIDGALGSFISCWYCRESNGSARRASSQSLFIIRSTSLSLILKNTFDADVSVATTSTIQMISELRSTHHLGR